MDEQVFRTYIAEFNAANFDELARYYADDVVFSFTRGPLKAGDVLRVISFVHYDQGRTFALTELEVPAAWRRQGIGRELHDLILAGRTEERATVTAAPNATAAQAAFRSWGWRKVARTRSEDQRDLVRDVLLTSHPVPSAPGAPFPPGRERAQNANVD